MPIDTNSTPANNHALPPVAATCPLQLAINVVGGRWKLHILRALFVHDAQRYNTLLKNVPSMSAKELTRNLRELENTGVVVQRIEAGVHRYSLTPLGEKLLPTFRSLGDFGTMLAESREPERRR